MCNIYTKRKKETLCLRGVVRRFFCQERRIKMPRNVEIKAKIENYEEFIKLARSISDTESETLHQVDTFFNTERGRLKLRCFENSDQKSQLIFYTRQDVSGPKLSEFSVTPIEHTNELKKTLESAYGIKGEVRKHRTLFMNDQTRIHVDKVNGLGNFMELEVQLKDDQTVEDGDVIAQNLKNKLNIKKSNLITCAYIDLLLQK